MELYEMIDNAVISNAKIDALLEMPGAKGIAGPVHTKREDGCIPCMYAMEKGAYDMVYRLYKEYNPDYFNKNGDDLLTYACRYNYPDIAVEIINEGDKEIYNKINEAGMTAILYAAKNNLKEVVKLLLNKDVNLDAIDSDGNTVLVYACIHNWEDIKICGYRKVYNILSNHLPAHVNKEGMTALMYACSNQIKSAISALAKVGNPNHVNNDGQSVLMLLLMKTSYYEALELFSVLMKENTELQIDQIDKDGNTALIYACQRNHYKIAQKLIAMRGARPRHVNNWGETALIWAAKNRLIDTIYALLRTKRCRPGQRDKNGFTAFMYSCSNPMPEISFALLKYDREIRRNVHKIIDSISLIMDPKSEKLFLTLIALDKVGSYEHYGKALLYACEYKRHNIARALIASGNADYECEDSFNFTALHHAKNNKMDEIVYLIEEERRIRASNWYPENHGSYPLTMRSLIKAVVIL